MAGVSLVGYSGSLIKDTIKDSGMASTLIRRFVEPPNGNPSEAPESTTVLVGEFAPIRSRWIH